MTVSSQTPNSPSKMARSKLGIDNRHTWASPLSGKVSTPFRQSEISSWLTEMPLRAGSKLRRNQSKFRTNLTKSASPIARSLRTIMESKKSALTCSHQWTQTLCSKSSSTNENQRCSRKPWIGKQKLKGPISKRIKHRNWWQKSANNWARRVESNWSQDAIKWTMSTV